VAEILSETLKRIGASPIERISVKGWLEDWLQAKERFLSPASFLAYAQAIRELLDYLGGPGSRRRIEAVTERDIEGFTSARDERSEIFSIASSLREPSIFRNSYQWNSLII
jgi:hypothetical protein